MTDLDALLPAIVSGDAVAFGQWLARAERPVRESLRAFARVVDTEAVLQEALLRTWQVAPRLESDGKPNVLLRMSVRIARNLAISEARRVRTHPLASDELELALADREMVSAARGPDPFLREALAACRDDLPEKPAQALAERITNGGGDPDSVLAERVGMKLNTFLQNFTRARKLLVECLARRGVDLRAEMT